MTDGKEVGGPPVIGERTDEQREGNKIQTAVPKPNLRFESSAIEGTFWEYPANFESAGTAILRFLGEMEMACVMASVKQYLT